MAGTFGDHTRRRFLAGLSGAGLACTLPGTRPLGGAAFAQAQPVFSFEALTDAARTRAAEPYRDPEAAGGSVHAMTYPQYRQINFNTDRSLWTGTDIPFRLQAFHLGWLFDAPVQLYEIVAGAVRPVIFTSEDFFYGAEASELVPPGTELSGISGFRLNTPLNRADRFDELVAFQGASYFRALGRDNAYGLSARGLAINTATGEGEEFPRFSAFYVERPRPGDTSITVHADLDSPSVTGAYRFVITPGSDTVMEVTARLFFRADVAHLGVAPLTSMFLFAEGNRSRFEDYRPQVHDSAGLQIFRGTGEVLWRALNNPPRLATSHFAETSPRGFGLHQRDRAFTDYQDPDARYEDRPSVDVEFLGDWGDGAVRLVEIPTDLEIHDNIVACWVPRGGVAAGEARAYDYRLHWGMLNPDPRADIAYVLETRTGVGGVSGVENETGSRKFVVDFRGGRLGRMGPDAKVEATLSVTRGEIESQAFFKLPDADVWRLAADVIPEPGAPAELVAFVDGYGERLSETWLYQWIE